MVYIGAMPFSALAVLYIMASQFSSPPVIPVPETYRPSPGTLALDRNTIIGASDSLRNEAELLQHRLQSSSGFPVPIRPRGSIELKLDPKLVALGAEGYRIHFTANHVTITAKEPAGVFYGSQTLLQLFPPDIFRKAPLSNAAIHANAFEIEDRPRFSWRGAHMDVARHFMPKEFVLKFLDLMALHKLNTFHWHLVDDNGWRVEIKRYPKLTEIGSLTDFSQMNPSGATRSASQPIGGFYSQDDVREVVEYARQRHITVVPEIELPGHANAAISAYPELGNRAQIGAAGKDVKFLGDYDNVFNVEESTITFLKNVLDEILELFPSKFIHIGGDEVWKEPWKQNPAAQEKKTSLGLKTEEELQSWFIRQFDDYLVAKGRRLIGWDEILEGGLAPNAAVMSWRGIEGGIAAAKAGHDVVMSPTSHAYFDYYQSKLQSGEPKGIGGYVPLEKVYEFEPVPPALNSEEAKHVLGGQGNLWSEYIPQPKHMEYMAYPRLCAMAEVLWGKNGRNWEDFSHRLDTHLQRLDRLDVNYRKPRPEPKAAASWHTGEVSEEWQTKEWKLSGGTLKNANYKVIFAYTWGSCRLDIKKVELTQGSKSLAVAEHFGRTGGDSKDNEYLLSVTGIKVDEPIFLRAIVRSDGGSDSNGDIFILPN